MKCADALFSKRWAPFALIGLLTALVWGHTVAFQFVWDDKQFIKELESIRSLKNVPAMFTSLEAQSSFPEGFKLFRPLRTVHYAILYQLSGEGAPLPWLYHLSNLFWHAGTAMLLYAVALLLFQRLLPGITERKSQWLALFTATAFAAHPIVSEVVCWAKSLDDAMAALFTLAAMRTLLKWNGERKGYVQALVWFALAVYSKISAVPFALVAFLIFHLVRNIPVARAARLSSGFVAVALVFMVHRHFVIGQSNQTAPLSGSYGQTLIDMFPVVPQYLRLLCGLPPFGIDYSFMKGHHAVFSGPVLAGLGLLLIATVATWRAFRKPDYALVAFGLVWVGAFLVPVSNVLPMMQYMADRFLYLPLIGWLFVLALLIHRIPRWQLSAPIVTGGVLAWSAIAWDRSHIWSDDVTLFVSTSREHPGIRRVENNAVAAIFNLPHVRTMFALDSSAKDLRVIATSSPGNGPAILETLLEAHRLFPRDERVASALGIALALSGQPREALPYFRLAVERRPKDPRYWANLGKAAMEANAWAEAKQAIATALEIAPDNDSALRTASQLAWRGGDFGAATNHFGKLLRLDPTQLEHARRLHDAGTKPNRLAGTNSPPSGF